MSPLPTMSVRCLPEHQPLVRSIARALRDRPALADTIGALLAQPDAWPTAAVPSPDMAAILARLEAVERWIVERNTDATRDVTQVAVAETAEEVPSLGDATDSNTAATRCATRPDATDGGQTADDVAVAVEQPAADAPLWQGEGRRRRLTGHGRRVLADLVESGVNPKTIAARFGIAAQNVRRLAANNPPPGHEGQGKSP